MNSKMIEQLKLRLRRDTDIGVHGILDSDATRYYGEDEKNYNDIRPPFFRDVDRIVHSKAYARYIDKTQVFFDINNANITHRSLHVILVSRVSRQIGRVLKLNTDLIEAIALGHDIGHAPYGHLGEAILDDISSKYNMNRFRHNAQSIRWLAHLEKRFPKKPARGLNLTLQVLDGILCHDGEIYEQKLKPVKVNGKTWEDHINEYEDTLNANLIKKIPATYEGIAVRFADTISYIGRDIEDAILLKFIKRSDIPKKSRKILGDTNRKIMNTLIMDLLHYSLDNDIIGYSQEIYEALKELKMFNYKHIYLRRDLYKKHEHERTFFSQLKEKFMLIFEQSLKDLEAQNYQSPIFRDHIEYIDDNDFSAYYNPLKNQGKLNLIVRDYIAGMSDKYFEQIFTYYRNKL
ncbi:MAG: HD domain-containing protein [Candidatus Lokiarchaeota archaeon]|nr:HD domain-containing protein [Candidatus Lokiarchaeota archaeon]MBD3343198.1 HD domain-containing protein [Candidatus Lokiarchaeota archaeon]